MSPDRGRWRALPQGRPPDEPPRAPNALVEPLRRIGRERRRWPWASRSASRTSRPWPGEAAGSRSGRRRAHGSPPRARPSTRSPCQGDEAPRVYGVNTGFGALSETRISSADVRAAAAEPRPLALDRRRARPRRARGARDDAPARAGARARLQRRAARARRRARRDAQRAACTRASRRRARWARRAISRRSRTSRWR